MPTFSSTFSCVNTVVSQTNICIVGFDDSPIASEAIVPITTIGQQIDKIAYEAMNLLVSQMNERKKKTCTSNRNHS